MFTEPNLESKIFELNLHATGRVCLWRRELFFFLRPISIVPPPQKRKVISSHFLGGIGKNSIVGAGSWKVNEKRHQVHSLRLADKAPKKPCLEDYILPIQMWDLLKAFQAKC